MVSARWLIAASLAGPASCWRGETRRELHHKLFEDPGSDANAEYDAQWYEQKLDHFGSGNSSWKQRYYTNFDHFKAGGPVFIYIGGEGPLGSSSVGERLVPGYFAEKYGGAAVALEHRFYGASQPFDSLATEHLKYLTSRQALHDLAGWQQWLTSKKSLHGSKFFCIGGSYPGNLAAWYRGEFPELTAGCWAASAPVHAVKDWPGYGQMVWRSLSTAADGSYDEAPTAKLYAGYQQIAQLLQQPLTSSIPEVEKNFHVCPGSLVSGDDRDNWETTITSAAASAVQYNHISSPGTAQIRDAVANASTPLEAALKVNELLGATPASGCADNSIDAMFREIGNATLPGDGSGNAGRTWMWQTCNEFGYYQTADGVWGKQNFFTRGASNPRVAYGFCSELFGIPDTDVRVQATNDYYGGLEPKSRKGGYVSHVLFSNGQLDPWSLLSVTEQPSFCPSCKAVVGDLGSHCVGLYAPSQGELPSQITIRTLAEQLFEEWGAKTLVV